MLSALCFVLILGVATAQEDHCCTPDVWEGEIHAFAGVQVGNTPRYVHNEDRILYDYNEKQRGYFHFSRFDDGSESSFRIIYHYNDKRRFFIEGGQCRIETIEEEMTRFCITSEATFIRDVTFGAEDRTLAAKHYYERVKNEEGADVGGDYFYVTSESCIPIRRIRYEAGQSHGPVPGSDIISEETYLDIVPEIRDREELVPPNDCVTEPFPKYIEEIPAYQAFLRGF